MLLKRNPKSLICHLSLEHLICLGIFLTLKCENGEWSREAFVLVIGISDPIILLAFIAPTKTRPIDLDRERKRRGPQPPKPLQTHGQAIMRLSFFWN
ncbi:hypothetical protein GGE15_006989 [Rhizobium esperanzae]|uniref:Uncharacterized protein n=1 Tax=Rhizobium esperanzae TaxID=1967781 RepID=A0A7W6USR0_9HYPH|nr:hypothetical protein [Rhizobium esperanzae]